MTCIVGLVDDTGVVYIGGDSFAGNIGTGEYDSVGIPKVFSKKSNLGDILLGVSGSFRPMEILRHFNTPVHPATMSSDEYLNSLFVNAVRESLKDGGYMTIEDSVEDGVDCLIGYDGLLWKMQRDNSIRMVSPFKCIGSGETSAKGALHALDYHLPPKDKVLRALQVAENCNAFVKAPFTVISGAKKFSK